MNSLSHKIIKVLSSIDESKVNPHPEIERPLKVAAQLLKESSMRENALLVSTGMFSNAVDGSLPDVLTESRCETLDLFASSLEAMLGDESYRNHQPGLVLAAEMARMLKNQYSRGELVDSSRTAH